MGNLMRTRANSLLMHRDTHISFYVCFFLSSDLSLYQRTCTPSSQLLGPHISARTWLCLITATVDVGGTDGFERDVTRKINDGYTLCSSEIATYTRGIVTESGEYKLHKDENYSTLFTVVTSAPKILTVLST